MNRSEKVKRLWSLLGRWLLLSAVLLTISLTGTFDIQGSALRRLPNPIRNPSFEYQTGAPVAMPAHWSPDAWGGGVCDFIWDSSAAHMGTRSARVTCTVADDARWTQSVPILPHRDYVLSGWIKTQDVAHSSEPHDAGANLSVYSTWTHTSPLWGTNDWTHVSIQFNSGDEDTITVAARLGYWSGTTTGTAWFDDIQLELVNDEFVYTVYLPLVLRQTEPPPYAWKTLVLIYRQTDVTYTWEGQTHHLVTEMNDADILRAWQVITQFPKTIHEWSGGNGHIVQTIVYPDRPIESLSDLWGGQGYWVSPSDIRPELDTYAPPDTFDSIIVIWRNDEGGIYVPMAGAWGLSLSPSSWANGAGYSLVNIPHNHGSWPGPYPDEVFVHEWNHQTTGFYAAKGYPMPDIDAAGSYGYEPENGSWRAFLSDVMQGRVWDGTKYIGITPSTWQSGTPTWPTFTGYLYTQFEPYRSTQSER